MTLVFKRADGSHQTVLGYRASTPGRNVRQFLGSKRISDLPSKVDLRAHMTPIENQHSTNSCVANATAGAYEYLFKRHKGIDTYDVSRLFIYYTARSTLDAEDIDSGTTIESSIDALRMYGACSEAAWPFEEHEVNTEPSDEAYDEASQFCVEDVASIPLELDAWKRCLAEGYPIIFGLALYDSFDTHRKRGLVQVPSKKEIAREEHGGHAMLCVGYSDPDKVFIVRNSWGASWGDKGYCYIPYTYMMSSEFNGSDTWMIRQVEELELDEELWIDDEESVLDDLHTEFDTMSDDDFADFIDEAGEHSIAERIALIMLRVAMADDDLSPEERAHIAGFLGQVLEMFGFELDPEKVLKHVLRLFDDEDDALLNESIALMGHYISHEGLASLWQQINAAAQADDHLDAHENARLNNLVSQWQIEDDGQYGDGDSYDEIYDEEGEDETYDDATYDDDDEAYDDGMELPIDGIGELMDEVGEQDAATHIALIMLRVANADGDLAESELEHTVRFLEQALGALGVDARPEQVLKRAIKALNNDGNDALFDMSVTLLGDIVSGEERAVLWEHISAVAYADGELDGNEDSYLNYIATEWQLEDG